MLLEKSADLTDLFASRKKEERNSAPSGTLTAQNFFLPSTKIRTVRYNSLSCVLPLGEEASFRTPGGEIFVPSHVGDVLRAHVSLRSPLALRWFTPNLREARGFSREP